MQHTLSLPHLAIAAGLVVLAGWLALALGNPLGALYSLIAASLVASRGFEATPRPALARVEDEP